MLSYGALEPLSGPFFLMWLLHRHPVVCPQTPPPSPLEAMTHFSSSAPHATHVKSNGFIFRFFRNAQNFTYFHCFENSINICKKQSPCRLFTPTSDKAINIDEKSFRRANIEQISHFLSSGIFRNYSPNNDCASCLLSLCLLIVPNNNCLDQGKRTWTDSSKQPWLPPGWVEGSYQNNTDP